MAAPTVLLFDIDGTLLHAGGAGRRAIVRVFEARYGHGAVFADMRFHGMTDRGIVRRGLVQAGLPCDEATIDGICAEYLAALVDEVPRATAFRVYPGVLRTLEQVAGRAAIAVGLGTGNLREGARLKLRHAGIDHHFAFGGFGCDHEDRATLVRIGAIRGAEHLGVHVDACRIVVIGDTPSDVTAARAIGAESVAVATSGFTPEALLASGATWAFATLEVPEVLPALLGS